MHGTIPCMSLKSIPLWLRAPRNSLWILAALALLLLIFKVSPQQLPVVLYKASLVALAVVIAYWIDRALFPYARPDSYLQKDWRLGTKEPEHDADYPVCHAYVREFCSAQIRRAIVVGCVVLAMALGL